MVHLCPGFRSVHLTEASRASPAEAHRLWLRLEGEKHVLAVAQTMEEAEQRANIIEQEFQALSATEWCKRYDVPVSFVPG